LKKEGDHFARNETICEVTVGGITIGIDVDDPGIIADILVHDDKTVPVGTEIVVVADGQENYMEYLEKKRIDFADKQKAAAFEADFQEKHQPSTPLTCLKAIKHLSKTDKLHMDPGI
jgi:pyruvate/2-oxoglutarate dehydrogenase complex dihydrolipoamide acyltransferase (E2) component